MSDAQSKAIRVVENFGSTTTSSIAAIGQLAIFMRDTTVEMVRRPFRLSEIILHMEFIGNQSLGIIIMSGFAIGGVFALTVGGVFRTFGAEGMMGVATAQALTRELAPMMTGFLLAGRGGSAMTAEIATMKVNEQVDAMESMGVSPIHYLVVPRVYASMVMTPLLSGIFVFMGLFGAYAVGRAVFDVDEGQFFNRIINQLTYKDVWMGLEKAFVFSIAIVVVACLVGLGASGGAKGVGRATTNSVIFSLLMILVLDLIFTIYQTVL